MGKRRREYLLALAEGLAMDCQGLCILCNVVGKLEDHVHPDVDNGNLYLCPHYDREEINLVMDSTMPPVLRCKDGVIALVTGSSRKRER